jgi:hypothetical protein
MDVHIDQRLWRLCTRRRWQERQEKKKHGFPHA